MDNTMPILLVPGLLSSPRIFTPLMPTLWRLGPVTVANHIRDDNMGAIARRILAEAPPRFDLAGHSMGGYIAFEIMRQAPQRVAKLALINTQARPDTAEATARRLMRDKIVRDQGGGERIIGDRRSETQGQLANDPEGLKLFNRLLAAEEPLPSPIGSDPLVEEPAAGSEPAPPANPSRGNWKFRDLLRGGKGKAQEGGAVGVLGIERVQGAGGEVVQAHGARAGTIGAPWRSSGASSTETAALASRGA